MQRHTLANHREVHPRKGETKSEEKDPLRLRKYANSPLLASSPPVSPSAAPPPSQTPPSSGTSSVFNFEGPHPFWEPDYPSQRFRPEEYEAEDSNDVCYSPPPQLFSPPVSPNEVKLQHTSPEKAAPAEPSVDLESMASSSNNANEGMRPTPFVPVYKGFTFAPGSNLTAYGTFADRSKLQDASLGGVYTLMNSTDGASDATGRRYAEDEDQPSATNAMVRKVSRQTEGEGSHFSSEAEIHPCTGVPVHLFDGDIPTMKKRQEKSFEVLETEKGIMEWNNSVFDERWLDPSPPYLEKPNDPQRPTTPGMITGQQIEQASAKHQRWISFLQDLESTRKRMDLSARLKPDPSIWGKGDRTPPPEKVLHEEHSTREPVPEPPWPGRLQEVVRDLEGGTGELPHGITHRPAVLRRYFYDRVFLEEWQWLGSEEQKMTKSGGRICSVGAVRDHTLRDIEDLISFMTAPVGHGIRKVAFPRTPEAAAMRKEDPFGGNSADPREEHFMRRFRRIGGYADITSFRGDQGRNAMTKATGNQTGNGADTGPDVSLQPQSPTSLALVHHALNQKLASAETHDVGQAGGDLAQKRNPEPDRGLSSGSKGISDSHGQNASSLENENPGASESKGYPLSEDVPVGHNEVEITPATTDKSSLRKPQLGLLRAADEHHSLSQENRSSSQATLTADGNDNMEPTLYHLMDDQDMRSDGNFANYTQHHELPPSFHATQTPSQDNRLPVDLVHARMFKRSDWENYVPPPSVMDSTQMQRPSTILSGPPPSTIHPGYRHWQSEDAPQQINYADFEPPAYDAPQQAVHATSWEEAYAQHPTRVLQRPSHPINQQTAYAGTEQTAYSSPLQATCAGPQSMLYGAQPMRHGFPQQAVGYAGSSTTDRGSSTAYEVPKSRSPYITQGMMSQPTPSWKHHSSQPRSYNSLGVRAPAPNRFAAVLARSKEFENYGIPQARVTPTSSQAFRQHRIRGTPEPFQSFAQNQAHGFSGPNEAYIQTQYGGAPIPSGTSVQNQIRGTAIPPQAYIQNLVRGTPAPNEAYTQSYFGRAPAPSQVLPQYPIRDNPTLFQSFPDNHTRSSRTPTQVLQNSYEWQSRFGIPQDMVKPDLPILHYRFGSDDMRPHHTEGVPTVAYQNLVRNLEHNYELLKAAEHLPFAEIARDTKPVEWGVLKIGNIPYDINRDQVISFLGNHAKLITANLGPAIHIIMDRVSGKTMDCFVEFLSPLDARATCNSINLRQRGLIRISDRVVDVNMSSQNELLATLFPKAKDVKWVNGKPLVMQPEEEWSSGFKSFVSAEELGLLVKHAEQPHRSNYTQRSPQRCYESMISLLAKFPWHSVENYTLRQRNLIFNAARQMLHILSINIRKQYGRDNHSRGGSTLSYTTAVSHGSSERNPSADMYGSGAAAYGGAASINPESNSSETLTEGLLKDLLSAGLNSVGFSENQRWQLYETCEYAKHHFIVSPMLQYWPFEVLGRKMRVEEDILNLYARIIVYNPEVEQTGFPFGSARNLTGNMEMESQTIDKIGSMELKILGALLTGGMKSMVTQLYAQRDMAALTL